MSQIHLVDILIDGIGGKKTVVKVFDDLFVDCVAVFIVNL